MNCKRDYNLFYINNNNYDAAKSKSLSMKAAVSRN